MDFLFNLPLLPDGALQGSILIPIFVGVLLMTFLNERFGIAFSGIVVPGYMVPIMIVAPWSAGIIAIEAIVTILIVQGLSVYGFRARIWPPTFGRDKFVFILLVSVLVRLVMELYLLPPVGEWIQQRDPYFDYRNRFKAIGLVVVPLLANMIWKPGVGRGIIHVGLITLATWAVVRFLVVPFTNYSVGYFYYIYEIAALEFANSPSSYIIILLGAFVASRANVIFGWEFSGIMIPTLLALALQTPSRFFITLIEAFTLLFICRWLVRLPRLRTMTWEGPRLVCLLYGTNLVLKIFTGHLLDLGLPGFPYEHLFGFGYLLSTLIALRMWQRQNLARVSLPVIMASLLIIIIGHGLARGLASYEQNRNVDAWRGMVAVDAPTKIVSNQTAFDLLQAERGRALRPGTQRFVVPMVPEEADIYRRLIRETARLARVHQGDGAAWSSATDLAAQLGLQLVFARPGDDGRSSHVLIREPPVSDPRRGWGCVLITLGSAEDRVVLNPHAIAEAESTAATIALQHMLQARASIHPGAHHETHPDGTADPLLRRGLAFDAASGALRSMGAIETRIVTQREQRMLWVADSLPPGLTIQRLNDVLVDLPLTLPPNPPPVANELLREQRRPSYLTITLTPADVQALLYAYFEDRGLAPGQDHFVESDQRDLVAHLEHHLEVRRGVAAQAERHPTADDLVLWDQAVWQPLSRLVSQSLEEGTAISIDDITRLLVPIDNVCSRFGYQVELIEHAGQRFVVLRERATSQRNWGSYVLRLGEAEAIHVLVPYPRTHPGSAAAGLKFSLLTGARVISIAPTGTWQEQRCDSLDRERVDTVYHVAFQSLQRASARGAPLLGLEILNDPAEDDDPPMTVLRQTNATGGEAGLDPAVATIASKLRTLGINLRLYDGSSELARFSPFVSPQAGYANSIQAGWFATLWLAADMRQGLAASKPSDNRMAAFAELDLLRPEATSIEAWLRKLPTTDSEPNGWPIVAASVRNYVRDRDLLHLEQALDHAGEDIALDIIVLEHHDLVMLVAGYNTPAGPVALIANCAPLSSVEQLTSATALAATLDEFLTARRAILALRPRMDLQQ